ncbi:MAG: LCP family protein [Patescibacteria group bacterium]
MSILTKKRALLLLGILGLVILFIFSTIFGFIFFYEGKERVNLLFLGESGPGHQGATLTDTIIFTSVSKEGTVLLSIPRDIWYEPLQTKINSLYFYGGLPQEEEAMEKILGQRIDAAILVDFDLFVKTIDLLEGIDVYVEGTFDDFKYPIPGKEEDLCGGDKTFACRYEHIHFDQGLQHMDGETALKFARSRNALGDEGTDYARSRRQQKVIAALKTKILSPEIFLRPGNILALWNILNQRLKSDLAAGDLISLAKILIQPSSRKMSTFVLDGWEKAEGYLYHPKTHLSGQWVLLPAGDSWEGVHQFVDSIL